jgi:hypothetical protein
LIGEKPSPFGGVWAQILDAEGASHGAGFAFGSFTEGYLNFGEVGAVAEVCVIAMVSLIFHSWLRSKRFLLWSAAPALVSFSYHFHRSEALLCATTARNTLVVSAGLLLIRYLSSRWGDRGAFVPRAARTEGAIVSRTRTSAMP